MTINRSVSWALAGLLALGLPQIAMAQGHGRGEDKQGKQSEVRHEGKVEVRNGDVIGDKHQDKGPKHVTIPQAVVVSREVLLANGYQVTQVAPMGATQVIYFRRGNKGRGRGLGPVQRMYVVPSGQIVQFQSVPQSLLATILSRLGM